MLRKLWTILTLRCAEADRLQAMGHRHCTRSERIALWIHQCLCKGCAAASRQLKILNDSLKDLARRDDGAGEGLSDEARARLTEALRDKQ